MTENIYKSLFEGKYTKSYDYSNLSFLEKIYYRFSPTTIVLRRMFNVIDSFANENKKHKIIDVGCGGGIKDLTLKGEVCGIDISESSLNNARHIYAKVIPVDLTKKLPFENDYFDIVFCSEVYGHVLNEDKNKFLGETKRILKTGGLFVFSCETQGNNWLTQYLKKTNRYEKEWIKEDGHVGLEKATDAIERFVTIFQEARFKINNASVFTIDELMPIFPCINFLFRANPVRMMGNLLLSPFYRVSLKSSNLERANNVLIYGRKK